VLTARESPIRAIVVDDSPTAQKLLVTILQEAEGIQVVGVGTDGEEAVRLTKRLRPDVVTMDVRMPRMDGLEATRRIMRDTPTPIVVVTADLMQADMNLTFEALRAGALTVVGKPGLADTETCEKVIRTVKLMAAVPVVHHWDRRDWRPADFSAPILVVQHVTNGFVSGLAEWLDGVTPLHVGLASHGETPQPKSVLLAPDDYHVRVNAQGVVELSKETPYKGLRPSANYLFHSLARAYGHRAIGIVLTGMGDDGAEGLLALRQAGGLTLAQDEQSCVVYGMPREAVARDAVDEVLPLDQIAPTLRRVTDSKKA
jgi:two-component system chemotaxis response regulator CheB